MSSIQNIQWTSKNLGALQLLVAFQQVATLQFNHQILPRDVFLVLDVRGTEIQDGTRKVETGWMWHLLGSFWLGFGHVCHHVSSGIYQLDVNDRYLIGL
jgi:hypothetical protein